MQIDLARYRFHKSSTKFAMRTEIGSEDENARKIDF